MIDIVKDQSVYLEIWYQHDNASRSEGYSLSIVQVQTWH